MKDTGITHGLRAKSHKIRRGYRYPPGSSRMARGVNFSVFSRYATSMELQLYESARSLEPFQVIRLDPNVHRTFFFWHVFVQDLPPRVYYTWRADGPGDTAVSGHRFDKRVELLDPWAKTVTCDFWDRRRTSRMPGQGLSSMRAAVVDGTYDWERDRPLNHPLEKCIIYELHVGGFTRHPSAGVRHPGTFLGVIEKIPHLKDLGITDVELMPCMAFDEQNVPEPAAALGLRNFWGYSTHSFFSPHPGYGTSPRPGSHLQEFRDMVKALHRAGIGVILDVAINHTAEGGAEGPIINFKGFANEIFYHLDPADKSRYVDYTGCGNTVNCNHPLVSRFILHCLEYWVREMHVDGFRFDLASVLARGEDGRPMPHAPVLWNIEFSEALADSKIIAEAWDAAGLYQVGAFPGFRWSEWNGRYRDVVRRFVRGDKGLVGELATRLAGSSDLYEPQGRLPTSGVNFVTCHDGFTLWDLVSYERKHNEANGEDNRDGTDENFSWNCGVEGETRDPRILALRKRQVRNFMAILFLSQGVPMILAGDEMLRTQNGNNNAYCQDNPLGWVDWTLNETNRGMLRFVRQMISLRKRHPSLMRKRFLIGKKVPGRPLPDVAWHGRRLGEPLWEDPEAQVLAFTLAGIGRGEEDLHVILNPAQSILNAPLPNLSGRRWHRVVDTFMDSPQDILEPQDQPAVKGSFYLVRPHSVAVFESRRRL
jgi:glycogen operon protein